MICLVIMDLRWSQYVMHPPKRQLPHTNPNRLQQSLRWTARSWFIQWILSSLACNPKTINQYTSIAMVLWDERYSLVFTRDSVQPFSPVSLPRQHSSSHMKHRKQHLKKHKPRDISEGCQNQYFTLLVARSRSSSLALFLTLQKFLSRMLRFHDKVHNRAVVPRYRLELWSNFSNSLLLCGPGIGYWLRVNCPVSA